MVEYFSGMISTDDPRHARLRRIVSNAFNPRRVRAIEDSIDAVAKEVVDRIAGSGECDFTTEVAAPFPLRIICEMMGVPALGGETVLEASNTILSMGDPEYMQGGHPPGHGLHRGRRDALLDDGGARQAPHGEPVDDVTSALVNADVDGDALTHQELASFFVLLRHGRQRDHADGDRPRAVGVDQYPDQREMWQADFEGHAATAVDEIVRWASPVIWMRRTVSEATVLSGTELDEGDKVLLLYSSANRDSDVFEDPSALRRAPQPEPAPRASVLPVRTSASVRTWPDARSA